MKNLIFFIFIFFGGKCFGFHFVNQDGKILKGADLSDTSSVEYEKDADVKIIEGKNYFIYHVLGGDGWYKIAKKFNISYSEIRLANKNTEDRLFPGMEILIPLNKLKPNDPFFYKKHLDTIQTYNFKKDKIKYHIVNKSQTLFGISKMYGKSVVLLKEWNNLFSNTINIGQKLIVSKDEQINRNDIVKSQVEKSESIALPKENAGLEFKFYNTFGCGKLHGYVRSRVGY